MSKNTSTKGITLIALIITIIILLILAGIAIAMLTGDNGLINKAKKAEEQTKIESIKEEMRIEILGKQTENEGKVAEKDVKEILEEYGILSQEEEKLMDKTLTTNEGKYEIKVSDIWNGTTTKDETQGPTFTKIANEPNIEGFNKSNTNYVSWNLNMEKTEYILKEKKMTENVAPDNWYDYTEGVNHWANVKTIGGGNECYWVWIPRYAYKVPTKGGTAKTIEIKFLEENTNKSIDGTTEITNTMPTPGTWVIHPAFTNTGNGGFGELTGIWVAKYEASSSSTAVVENPTVEQLAIDGGSEIDTDLKVRVKPNVTSWRNITVNNIFTVCRNLTLTGNSLEDTSNLDAHMMKNTEWGAVAYLSMSVYGKNSEVWNNPYYNNTTNYSSITGLCSNEIDGKDKEMTDISKTCKYNEVGGGNASTTGNVYGVYDMAGGAWEYTAGYLNEIKANTNYTTLASADTKYKDLYLGNSSDRNTNYNANAAKYGDALYETSSSGDSSTGSWDFTTSHFPYSNYPMFLRGGRVSGGSSVSGAGLFAFSSSSGGAYTYDSFRPVLLSFKQ